MSVLKYKDPVTGEVKKVGSPIGLPVGEIDVDQLKVSEDDNGKILMVVNGKATWVTISNAEGVSF